MTKQIRVTLLGGDARQISMAKALGKMEFEVYVWGLGDVTEEHIAPARLCQSWQEGLEGSDAVILPLPATRDGVRVNSPQYGGEPLRLDTLLEFWKGRLLLGGRMSPELRGAADQKQIRWMDYFDSEGLQLKNAIPTAEGAIAIAMQELPVTLDGCETAVIGYGRIGSVLADKLQVLGASVTVYARRQESLTRAALRHHGTQLLGEEGLLAPSISPNCRVLFNTVPKRLLSRQVLEKIPRRCLLVDLASAPGGIDFQAAEELGIRAVWATA
ncbi:MAG: dipicolinate synthase, partial [Clostridia bacterium]|nr:dipicolinate synthase [Clostridia bacterium]